MAAQGELIIVSQRLGPLGAEEARVTASGLEVRSAPLWTLDEIRTNAAAASAVIVGAVESFDAAALGSLPNIRAVVRRGIGVDNVDVDAATQLGIVVANVPDASVDEVSEHALTLLLALERRVVRLDAAVRAGQWQRDPSAINAARAGIRRMSSLTLGIVGLGRIGRALARKARPLYGRMIGSDPYVDRATAESDGVELVELGDVLAQADHISLHLPMSTATYHLINSDAFARMRQGVIVVNTARGGVIDEAALTSAIAAGHVAGAGLDVTEVEPLAADDPSLSNEAVLLTAHSAHASTTASAELAKRSVDAAIELLHGRHPGSVVNPEVFESPRLRIPELRR